MMKRAARFAISLSLCAFSTHALATEYGVVQWNEYLESPSIVIPQSSNGPEKDMPSVLGTVIICIDAYTQALLNCPYTLWLKGIDKGDDPQVVNQISPPLTHIQIYGGHEHDLTAHPYYWVSPPQEPIQVVNGTFTRPNDTTVTGHTANSVVFVEYNAPQTAGSIWQEVDIGVPRGWHCVGMCYTFTDTLEHDTILVGFFGLQQLPSQSGTGYFVARGGPNGVGTDELHPDDEANYGTAYMIGQLMNIANEYHRLSGYAISVNDMSLPEGGIFDIMADKTYTNWAGETVDGTWNIPHRDHRTGNAFDLNETDGSGFNTPCELNLYLWMAISETNRKLTGNYNSKTPDDLICEPGYDKVIGEVLSGYLTHINAFDPSQPDQVHE